ncbi:MAG: signal peptidase II [Candidatus Moraniibacteriota bacterium]
MLFSQKIKKNAKLSLIALSLIVFDQLTKYLIRFFGGFYICNKGIAFGISLPHWLIVGFIIAILFFTGFLILNLKLEILNHFSNSKFKNLKFISNYPLVLILSGAISNLFDRLYFGCVIDFINLRIWPIFNLADIFICLGAFLLIIKLNKK